ncbi:MULTISPECIES: hypothetical protein [unclassified Tateyamaria]|jgi:hypothetical protein|nr:hypothetical protein [Tateyamaria sp. Alg231-49]
MLNTPEIAYEISLFWQITLSALFYYGAWRFSGVVDTPIPGAGWCGHE